MARDISAIYDPRVSRTKVAELYKACLEDLFKLGLPNTQEGMDATANFANVFMVTIKLMDASDARAGCPRSHVLT
jgi:hypothetical protein